MSRGQDVTYVFGMDKNDGGWGARIRTWECRYQKPMPYRLATPQQDLGDEVALQIAA